MNIKDKVLQIFFDNSSEEMCCDKLVNRLGYHKSAINIALHKLIKEGRIIIIRKKGLKCFYSLNGNTTWEEKPPEYRDIFIGPHKNGIDALMISVLTKAIKDLDCTDKSKQKDAILWFKTADNGNPFNFYVICETVGMDASKILQGIKQRGWIG